MKKFIVRIAIFLIIFWGLVNIVGLFIPYHYGNPWYTSKINVLKSSKNKKNTYFFGSSRVYRQINPAIIDSTLASFDIHSFNLGSPATFPPQSYYLVDNFLESKVSQNTRYIILELLDVTGIPKPILHQERSSFWLTPKEYIFGLTTTLADKNMSLKSKGSTIISFSISVIENLFKIGHFSQSILDQNNYYEKRFAGRQLDGYYPLEHDAEDEQNENVLEHFEKNQEEIKKNSTLIQKRKTEIEKIYTSKIAKINKRHLVRLKNISAKASKKGIEVLFLLNPRSVTQGSYALSKQFPKDKVIDMANPIIYPQFYKVENSFDKGHLDNEGSNEFSKIMAQKILEKLSNNNK